MLTALDFMDGLLYSQDGLWIRDDGAGSARLGLNAYATCGSEADVYLVKLPKGGTRLERGQPFGHVELGRRTVALVAPVSGTVLYPNTALRGEPALVARDPYGQGFLLELDGVAGEHLDALLDRDDAVSAYARFDEAGQLGAQQAIEPGRPWPTTLALGFGGRALIRARIMPPLGNEVFTPDWVAGDTWTVETRADGAVRRFAFEVLGEGKVAQEEVVRVRAIEVAAPGALDPKPAHARVLHFRRDDHTLAAWDLVSVRDPLSLTRHYNPRGREAWLGLKEPADTFILDHPKFPVGVDDESRDLPVGEDKKALPATSVYVKFRGGLTRIESEMRTDVEREDGRGTERLLSLLVYERGEPWWTEAARLLGDKELVKAKLVKA